MVVNDEENAQQAKLLALVREAIEHDDALRVKFEIGDKFRFVRERLNEIVTYLESSQAVSAVKADVQLSLQENEVMVYVYIFNAKGVVLRNWINMLSPKVFYEYSVNRPIYSEANAIEAMLRTKKDKPQHAYLAVAVKKADILQSIDETSLVKVKEGSLKLERLISFFHNGNEYTLSSEGQLVKKNN